jgi:uncharacterized membrane protein
MALHKNINTWERALSIVAGGALLASAFKRGRSTGIGAAAAGVGLLARGATGYCPVNASIGRGRIRDDTRKALAGPRGVRLQGSISIACPQAEAYEFWRDVDNLPLFMRGVDKVTDLGSGRSHWTLRGPGRKQLQWDAELINDIEPELLAWRSLPGADIASAGSVHFRPLKRGGTEVSVKMQYDAPGGKATKAFAWLAGHDPASELREDLRRLKGLLEAGEYPTVDGQPSGPRSAAFKVANWVQA